MKKILLATHGYFAKGINSSLEIIVGEQENLYTINAYVDDKELEKQLDDFIKTVDEVNDTLIVITDLFGGSVNQKIVNKFKGDNIHIITGLNLPLLLEIQMLPEEQCTAEKIKSIVDTSKEQIKYLDTSLLVDDKDDFDF